MASQKINDLPSGQADYYLEHKATAIDKSLLAVPSSTYVDDILVHSTRNNRVIGNYQCRMSSGCINLINSGGESKGSSDLQDSIFTVVVNKRAGNMGLFEGRKAFQRPFAEGIDLLNATQDVYLDKDITIVQNLQG